MTTSREHVVQLKISRIFFSEITYFLVTEAVRMSSARGRGLSENQILDNLFEDSDLEVDDTEDLTGGGGGWQDDEDQEDQDDIARSRKRSRGRMRGRSSSSSPETGPMRQRQRSALGSGLTSAGHVDHIPLDNVGERDDGGGREGDSNSDEDLPDPGYVQNFRNRLRMEEEQQESVPLREAPDGSREVGVGMIFGREERSAGRGRGGERIGAGVRGGV